MASEADPSASGAPSRAPDAIPPSPRQRRIFAPGWPRRLVVTLSRLWERLGRHHASLLAAGVAYYALLSLFPSLAALMALGGLFLSPADIVSAAGEVEAVLPEAAGEILLNQLEQIAAAPSSGLQLTAVLGFAVALYSASRAVGSLVEGIRAAYEEPGEESWLTALLRNLALTFLLLLVALVLLVSILVIPPLVALVFDSAPAAFALALLRWPLLAAVLLGAIALVYRASRWPDPARPNRPYVTRGAVTATLGILVASVVFSIYVENFANYNQSFGTLGGVITLLIWLWTSAFIALAGAELDAMAGQDP